MRPPNERTVAASALTDRERGAVIGGPRPGDLAERAGSADQLARGFPLHVLDGLRTVQRRDGSVPARPIRYLGNEDGSQLGVRVPGEQRGDLATAPLLQQLKDLRAIEVAGVLLE